MKIIFVLAALIIGFALWGQYRDSQKSQAEAEDYVQAEALLKTARQNERIYPNAHQDMCDAIYRERIAPLWRDRYGKRREEAESTLVPVYNAWKSSGCIEPKP